MILCRSRRRQVVEMHCCRLFCWAHNPKVGGSNPPPATNEPTESPRLRFLRKFSPVPTWPHLDTTSTQLFGHPPVILLHGADVLPLAEGIRRVEDGPGEAAEGTGERKRQVETAGGGAVVGQTDPEGYCGGKLLSPERHRCAVEHAREEYAVSERRACRVV